MEVKGNKEQACSLLIWGLRTTLELYSCLSLPY